MDNTIQIITNLRKNILQLTEELNTEQLNMIPPNFNNNIIWNLAHLVSAEQGICYKRSGLPLKVDEEFFTAYMPGSKPNTPVNTAGIAVIKSLLISSAEALWNDYNSGMFKDYTPVITRYGVALNNINEAIEFLLFHEGLHTGYIMALKRAIIV